MQNMFSQMSKKKSIQYLCHVTYTASNYIIYYSLFQNILLLHQNYMSVVYCFFSSEATL